jgi:hypothetical protein
MKSTLRQTTTSHLIKGKSYDVTLSFEAGKTFHSFEVSRDCNDFADSSYREGGLNIEVIGGMEILTDYDGVSVLPLPVALALEKHGIGFAPYVFPVELI